jgi:hypothetical protein
MRVLVAILVLASTSFADRKFDLLEEHIRRRGCKAIAAMPSEETVAGTRANEKTLRIEANYVTKEWRGRCLMTDLPRSRLVEVKAAFGDQLFGMFIQWSATGWMARRFAMA